MLGVGCWVLVLTDNPSTVYPGLYKPSVPWALARLPTGVLGYVVTDQEFVSQRLVGTLYMSLADFRNRRACVDAEVPGPFDPQPLAAFRGDTMLVLIQAVPEDMKARTVIRRYLVAADKCHWYSS